MLHKTILLICIFIPIMVSNSFATEHRIGIAANYWVALEDIEVNDKKIDDDGLSLIASYQYWPGIFGIEVDLEFLPDRFGDSAISPQAYLLIGKSIYGGIGIGMTYSDSEFSDEPFFALRAGLNLELLPGIYADIYGNYRFNDSAALDNEQTDIDTDTIFLGAALRLAL